ncbi:MULTISPECIES: c-type cytochrome [unclassified Sphingobium]|uniref:c-type cytochrome n=1 Tax=unclassified Sphingobium TaxID=2611147 RepID=UPI002224AB2D|nr:MULTISPECIES: cytochrome c [unclassified Sphingobium]MCW2397079.1 mono/diheme cytochrome c family protein [Sphingobium sp. B2D3C]
MTRANAAKMWSISAIAALLAAAPLALIPAQAADAPAGDPAHGKQVFESTICGACHTLAAADASGPIGPSLDGNANLTHALIVERVTKGAGAMPGYEGQLSEKDINDVATYVMSVAAKPQ